MKFEVQVTETLQKRVEVEAQSAEDAEAVVRRQYRVGEIVLDYADYIETEVSVVYDTIPLERLRHLDGGCSH